MKFKTLAFVVAFCGGWALSQTTLGNMFQLGQSTSAAMPSPSVTIIGSLLYDLDAGNPRFNDGVAWNHMAWTVGVACPAGYVLTLATNNGALTCVNSISSATTAGSATYATYAGQLWTDPSDCAANQYATSIAASGNLTCAQVATSQLSGTITDAQLANNYSGVGACGANTWASTLSDNAAPTCTQPAFSNISGTVTDGQLANNYSGTGACTGTQVVTGVNDNAAPTCATPTYASESQTAVNLVTTPTYCGTNQYAYGVDKYGNALCRTFSGCCGF